MEILMEFLAKISNVLPHILNTSITAGIVILFVLAARLLIRRAPKVFSYALWGIVLLRLLLPAIPESPASIVPEVPELMQVQIDNVLPDITFETPSDWQENQYHLSKHEPGEVLVQVYHNASATNCFSLIWLIGIAVMLTLAAVRYFRLRKKLQTAIKLDKRVYLADGIPSAFVMGLLRPKIYLPGNLNDWEKEYVLLHERYHIKRLDHIIKALSFFTLCLHWFNPLVWVAFYFASIDMEMSCDEAVIRRTGIAIRADYCTTLLHIATGRQVFSGTPLAFGEGNPKGRIRNLANWKKPAVWVVVLVILLCMVLVVCLLTDPKSDVPSKQQVYQALVNKDSILNTGIIGVSHQALRDAWGEPVWELFGMWGEIWEVKGAGHILVYFDSNGIVENVKLHYIDAVEAPSPTVSESYAFLPKNPDDLSWNTEPVFEVSFAGNTSLSQTMTITNSKPFWTIYVYNTGSDTIKMELDGQVYVIRANNHAVFDAPVKWEAGTYPVSFSTNGIAPMEGIAVCVASESLRHTTRSDFTIHPQMSFAGLKADSTQVDEEYFTLRHSTDLEYHITYDSPSIILEVGVTRVDGTEHMVTVEHGAGSGIFQDLPAGDYKLFVRNIGFQNQGNLPGIAVESGAMVCTIPNNPLVKTP